jgi:hypothetical protein
LTLAMPGPCCSGSSDHSALARMGGPTVDPMDDQAEVPDAISQERCNATRPARLRVRTVRLRTRLGKPSVPEHRQAGGARLPRNPEGRP